ncbi:hypothetical protein ADL25_39970 [Streptomyces sp. NRRL F-5122]|nr:hypothetical protein ADL25_39970 [Streptomyces sp. NRRL F-5122]
MVQGFDLPVITEQGRQLGGTACSAVRLVTAQTALMVVLPVLPSVRRRLIWMACRAPGKSRLLTVATLIRRISERP